MPNYATTTLIGHLGRDPELKRTQDGTAVASFSIATSRKRRDEDLTTWWRCSLFGRRAEVLCQYLKKGDPVLVTGEPYMRPWRTNDGVEKQSMEVFVSDFAFVGGKDTAQASQEPRRGDSGGNGYQPSAHRSQTPQAPDFDDDIPF